LIGIVLAGYFLWYVPQTQAREYITKSQPLFEMIAVQIPTIKENTFLDRNTLYHKREDARDDTLLDIEELEAMLANVKQVQGEIARLPTPKKVLSLDELVNAYLAEAQRVISLNLADQVFSKKIIDAYGDVLDGEIAVYVEMYYSGGDDRTPFILQTESVANYAEDALSRMNNLEPSEDIDTFHYEIKLETLQDIKETFTKLNEYYRLFQYDLVEPEVGANAERNNRRNEQLKAWGPVFIKESNIAQGYRSLEEQAKGLESLYREIGSNVPPTPIGYGGQAVQ